MVSYIFVCRLDPKPQWSIGRTNCSYCSTRVDLYSHQILFHDRHTLWQKYHCPHSVSPALWSIWSSEQLYSNLKQHSTYSHALSRYWLWEIWINSMLYGEFVLNRTLDHAYFRITCPGYQESVAEIAKDLLCNSSKIHSRHCVVPHPWFAMMTSSNGNFFRVTGHLCGEFTDHRWIPRTKASVAELWCFLWSAPD